MDDGRKKGRERLIGNRRNLKGFLVSLGIVSRLVVVGEEEETRTEAAQTFVTGDWKGGGGNPLSGWLCCGKLEAKIHSRSCYHFPIRDLSTSILLISRLQSITTTSR